MEMRGRLSHRNIPGYMRTDRSCGVLEGNRKCRLWATHWLMSCCYCEHRTHSSRFVQNVLRMKSMRNHHAGSISARRSGLALPPSPYVSHLNPNLPQDCISRVSFLRCSWGRRRAMCGWHYLGSMNRRTARSDSRGSIPVKALLPSMNVGNYPGKAK